MKKPSWKREATRDHRLSNSLQSALVFAARYAHSRKTGAAAFTVNAITENWDKLSPATQHQLKKESREATCNHEDWSRLEDLAVDGM